MNITPQLVNSSIDFPACSGPESGRWPHGILEEQEEKKFREVLETVAERL